MAVFQRERGPWVAITTTDGRLALESADFTHDVRLYVDGDFESEDQKLVYAQTLASALNGVMPLSRRGDHAGVKP